MMSEFLVYIPRWSLNLFDIDTSSTVAEYHILIMSLLVDVNTPGVKVPRSLNYGLRTAEKNLLFGHLPIVCADARALHVNDDLLGSNAASTTLGQSQGHKSNWEIVQRTSEEELMLARERANRLARLVDLRNANAKGVMHENRRRIVEAFGETREDTGRPEVQGETLDPSCSVPLHYTDAFFVR